MSHSIDLSLIRLRIPVTKPLPLDQLKSIINEFKRKKLSFGIVKEVDSDLYVLWRQPEAWELDLCATKCPSLRRFEKIWDFGILLENYGQEEEGAF